MIALSDSVGAIKQVTFPEGLVGCSDWRHFVLLDADEAGPVRMLQCLDDPEVGFFVTDPKLLLEDYQLEIPPSAASAIDLVEQEKAIVLCTLVVKQDPLVVTANLLGPLVINRENGRGVQVVLSGSDYSARHVVVGGPAEMS
jgi:flagellar assembly factor FliW